MAEAPETFVTPATPIKNSPSTIDPSANLGVQQKRNALNDANLAPQDFTHFLPTNLPTPPFIFVPGVPNFRDMGGWPCPPPSDTHPADITNPGSGKPTQWQLRRNLLFRCGHPTQLTSTGLMTLDALGVTDIFDLRSMPEIAKLATAEPDSDTPFLTTSGHIELPGITRHFTPVYTAEDYGPVALARKLQWYTAAAPPGADYSEGFVSAYRDIGTFGASSGSYAKILRQILRSVEAEAQRDSEAERKIRPTLKTRPVSVMAGLDGILGHLERFPSPDPNKMGAGEEKNELGQSLNPGDGGEEIRQDGGVVFHCTAGKDRTGVLAAVIHLLVGVDIEDIAWEYAVTEPGLGSWRRAFIERISRQGMGSGQSGKPAEDQPREGEAKRQEVLSRADAARICGSRAGNIRAFIQTVMDGEWGGVERYLTEMVGLSQDEVQRLRSGLVVKVPEDEGDDAVRKRVPIEGWSLEGGMDEDREL